MQYAAHHPFLRSIRYEMSVEYKKRESIKSAMTSIVHSIFEVGHPKHLQMFEQTAVVENHDCYKTVVTEFKNKCFNFK